LIDETLLYTPDDEVEHFSFFAHQHQQQSLSLHLYPLHAFNINDDEASDRQYYLLKKKNIKCHAALTRE
jgi:hypothetical protein